MELPIQGVAINMLPLMCTYMQQNTPEPSSCAFSTAFLASFSLLLLSLCPVGPHRLIMQNDGNLGLYDSVNAVVSESRACLHSQMVE